ncbi:MAG: c-type cytochrome [Anaerolineales bacterium]|jgi:mono/diheme cytochrome c family protein
MGGPRRIFLVFGLILMAAIVLPACGPGSEAPGEAMLADSPAGAEPGAVPEKYRDLVNPLAGDPEAIAAGSQAYASLCSQCHGSQGAGDGPAGAGVDPMPGDLTDSARMPTLSDGYLFWRISEGGSFDPFNSLMPSWGTLLSEREIWELVSYIRTLSS